MRDLNLSSGASYFRSPGAATAAAIAALRAGKTYYGPAEGTPELRQAIADNYRRNGIPVAPEQVVITPGTKQALFNLFSVLLRDGDEVVVPTPAWFGFNELLKYSKGKLVTVQTRPEQNYNLEPEALREVITPQTRLLLLTNPANPTGRIYTREELEPIIDLLNEFPNLYLISDEIYDLDTYGKPFTSALACQGPQERIIVVNGFSKNFAMSGWRVGFIIAPNAIARQSVEFQSATFSGVSMFIQDAALATVLQQEPVLEPMLDILQEHRQVMQQGLQAIPHVRFYVPDGAYYFFPDLSYYINSVTPSSETLNSTQDLCRYLHLSYNLQVVNGDLFGGIGHVRMSFAVERPVLEEAMQVLRHALTALRPASVQGTAE